MALVVVGTNSVVESEGYDRDTLALPGRQDDLVRAVVAANPAHRGAGQRRGTGAHAVAGRRRRPADRLVRRPGVRQCGRRRPARGRRAGRRLPTTWPAAEADVPVLDCTPVDGVVEYAEGVHIGYRAWLRSGAQPAYWFGSGRGYTSFELTGVAAPAEAAPGQVVTVTVEVSNTGERDGKEVVQVYAERPDSVVDRPVRWLVGSAAVRVPAGETARVEVAVPTRYLAYWADGWQYEPAPTGCASAPRR
ncbi:hypothetical protein A7K94_0218750 [Modestobacter sp. VKM Ac-2676]|nr:hypothetical protein A7K94_0218750 [Modestobacter sp. VKM Ac-2676]